MSRRLYTLASLSSEVGGVGLHSGVASRVKLRPAAASEGIHFVRTDLPQAKQQVRARLSAVASTELCTTLNAEGASVSTVEHLMAALCGMGIAACRVEVDAPELPILDGSAAPWVAAIREVGVTRAAAVGGGAPSDALDAAARTAPATLSTPVWVEDSGSWAVATPALSPRLTVGLAFPSHPLIGRQWASWAPGDNAVASFADDVAPARTFALAEQLDAMRSRGLIRGGSLENARVCDATRWINEDAARFANEPARHKLLDLIGDLALIGGGLPKAHVVTFKAGHGLHVALAKAIAKR